MNQNQQNCLEKLNDAFAKDWLWYEEADLKAVEDVLWNVIVEFQDYPFATMRGLPFSYRLKVGRNGRLNKELLVNRRKGSKTLAWSSVRLAFRKAKEMQGDVIKRPKQLGDIRGISYIYAMFLKFGIINGE